MSSVIDICNLALGELGAGNISSLSEQSSEAKACSRYYDISRKSLLREYEWNFATKIISLTLASGESDKPNWEYIYLYPSACLKLIKLYDENNYDYTYYNDVYYANNGDTAYEYDVIMNDASSSNLILCNVENARIKYIADITDPTLFRTDFIMVLSYLLASNIAQTLTGDNALKTRSLQLYINELMKAKSADASERNINFTQHNPYIKVRR